MKRAYSTITLLRAVAATAVGSAAVPGRLCRCGAGTAQVGFRSAGAVILRSKWHKIKQSAFFRHMGAGSQRVVAGRTDGGSRCDICVVIGTGQIGLGQDRRRQRIFIKRDGKSRAAMAP